MPSDQITLPGVVARWITLSLSVGAMLVMSARWTAKIDGSLEMISYKLRQAEEVQIATRQEAETRAKQANELIAKIEEARQLFEKRSSQLNILTQDMERRKKMFDDINTSIGSLDYRVHNIETMLRRMHDERKE